MSSGLERARRLKQDLYQYREELMKKINEYIHKREKLYDEAISKILERAKMAEYGIANVAGQYIIVPYLSKEISNYPRIKYTGALKHLAPPESMVEKDVIMPDVLYLDINKISKLTKIYEEIVLGMLLYRRLPTSVGQDICDIHACYAFATEFVSGEVLPPGDAVDVPMPAHVARPTLAWAASGIGYAIYEGDTWITEHDFKVYRSPSKMFCVMVETGTAKFVKRYESSQSPFPEELRLPITLYIPGYWDEQSNLCYYPPESEYKGDFVFRGTALMYDMVVIIARFHRAFISPFCIIYGDKYTNYEDIARLYGLIDTGVFQASYWAVSKIQISIQPHP